MADTSARKKPTNTVLPHHISESSPLLHPHPHPQDTDSDDISPPTPESDQETAKSLRRRKRRTQIAVALTIFITVLTIGLLIAHIWLFPRHRHVAPKPEPEPKRPVVDLNYTIYEGDRLPEGINRFLGMRYAAPPVGERRWRAPVEPVAREGGKKRVEEAREFRPICLATGRGFPFGDQDEDCLFVNVWAPSGAKLGDKLPVWVFISGGGYNSLSNANWNGAGVVRESGNKIVFVNFNYRVGMWGFLASERVRKDGDLNAGLLDQRMLFKWIKKHIASFGGDPDHIIIHGASAGAGSVAMHMIAYGGRNDNLFAGAIAESVFFPAQPRVPELEYQFDRLLQQTGCDSASPTKQLFCLRQQDVKLLQAANHAEAFPGRPSPPNPLFYWTPCIDGDFLQDLPYKLFEDGRYIDVPLLAGTASDEGSVFAINAASQADMARFFANNYPHLTPRETKLILQQYPKLAARPRHADWYPTTSQAYGEATFICPNINIMNALSRPKPSSQNSHHHQTPLTTNNTTSSPPRLFAYRYNVQDALNTASGLGVPHLFDAPAIFGPGNCPTPASYWSYNAAVVPVFMAYCISFVRALDPNVYRREGSAVWESWGGGDGDGMRRLLVETGDVRMEVVGEEEGGRCEFWRGLGDVLEQV